MSNCDRFDCQWVKDSENPDHYYCLRCDKERWINRNYDNGWVFVLLLAIFLFIFIKGAFQVNAPSVNPIRYEEKTEESF